MNNREILKAVLEKAINKGYTVNQASFDYLMNLLRKDDKTCRIALDYYIKENKYYDTIFSHDFAKKFWGESKTVDVNWRPPVDYLKDLPMEDNRIGDGIFVESMIHHLIWDGEVWGDTYTEDFNKGWEHHLQQLVLEEEPLKYLEKFLKGSIS